MTGKLKLVTGDTRPRLEAQFTDANSDPQDPTPINITGGTPHLKLRAAGTSAVLATLDGFVSDGVNGWAYWDWGATTLAKPAGDYEIELSVTFADGTRQTVYDVEKLTLREAF